MTVRRTVSRDQYNEEKQRFFRKHGENTCHTGEMDKHSKYLKTYAFQDGAAWYEWAYPKYESVEVEVKKVMLTVTVKLLCTEYWNTDNSASKYYYEEF